MCQKDKGILQEVRFYDTHAIWGHTDNKYPLASGGILNTRIICGDEACLKKAMAIRKAELQVTITDASVAR